MSFNEITLRDLQENPVKLLAEDWALLSAGDGKKWNAMTVSWGGMGEIWGKDAVFVFVRPQRYTLEFIDKSDCFTLSFGLEKQTLGYLGQVSGRDEDKIAKAGLRPVWDGGAVYPENAKIVIAARKIFRQRFDAQLCAAPEIAQWYPEDDHHFMFVGFAEKVLHA
jgi:flavin reductase (DIM6/NTAB) family NADH-FMN oxidoreductase RutF